MSADPAPGAEIEQRSAVQAAWSTEVHVLDGGGNTQSGDSQVAGQAAVVSVGQFAVHEQPESILEAEVSIGGRPLALLGQAGGHARQIEGVELVERG
jgi:uncharacterized Zn-binding protein involved in type VI secretion